MASRASSRVAVPNVPRTDACRCGCTTATLVPPPSRRSPPIVMGRSIGASAVSAASRASSRARSALPGAYPRTGSFTGVGTLVTASMKGNPP